MWDFFNWYGRQEKLVRRLSETPRKRNLQIGFQLRFTILLTGKGSIPPITAVTTSEGDTVQLAPMHDHLLLLKTEKW